MLQVTPEMSETFDYFFREIYPRLIASISKGNLEELQKTLADFEDTDFDWRKLDEELGNIFPGEPYSLVSSCLVSEAARSGKVEIFNFLVAEVRPDFSVFYLSAIFAITEGHFEIIQALYERMPESFNTRVVQQLKSFAINCDRPELILRLNETFGTSDAVDGDQKVYERIKRDNQKFHDTVKTHYKICAQLVEEIAIDYSLDSEERNICVNLSAIICLIIQDIETHFGQTSIEKTLSSRLLAIKLHNLNAGKKAASLVEMLDPKFINKVAIEHCELADQKSCIKEKFVDIEIMFADVGFPLTIAVNLEWTFGDIRVQVAELANGDPDLVEFMVNNRTIADDEIIGNIWESGETIEVRFISLDCIMGGSDNETDIDLSDTPEATTYLPSYTSSNALGKREAEEPPTDVKQRHSSEFRPGP